MVDSFFFGTEEPHLFGSYHAPAAPARAPALLLCPALGHEHVQCHRAYRLLAERLAEAGFAVLRFEYRGLGNAEGSLAEASLEDWVSDSNRALVELAQRSGADSFCIGGIRLGATLSALTAGRSPSVIAALLWYPILEGLAYLGELSARHAAFLRGLPSPAAAAECQEILGFQLGPALCDELATLETGRLGRCLGSKHVLLLEDEHVRIADPARQRLAAGCADFEAQTGEAQDSWLEQPHRIFEPRKSLDCIARWMERLG